jgi:hypothetical protein
MFAVVPPAVPAVVINAVDCCCIGCCGGFYCSYSSGYCSFFPTLHERVFNEDFVSYTRKMFITSTSAGHHRRHLLPADEKHDQHSDSGKTFILRNLI